MKGLLLIRDGFGLSVQISAFLFLGSQSFPGQARPRGMATEGFFFFFLEGGDRGLGTTKPRTAPGHLGGELVTLQGLMAETSPRGGIFICCGEGI